MLIKDYGKETILEVGQGRRINGWSIPTSFVVGGTDHYAIVEHIVYYKDLSKMAAVQACYCYVGILYATVD